jgi:Bacterial type II and III secretion system protein
MDAQKMGRLFVSAAVMFALIAFSARAAEKKAPPPAKVPKVKAAAVHHPAPGKPATAQATKPAPKPAPAHPAESAGYGRDVPLEGLSDPQAGDVYEVVAQSAIVNLNYQKTDEDMPDRTVGMTRHVVLQRKDSDGSTRTLLVGLTCYTTQYDRLYLWGTLTAADGAVSVDPNLDALMSTAQNAVKGEKGPPRKYSVHDLLYQTYQLSNIDVQSCINMLKSLGYNTSPPGQTMDLGQLPDIFPIPFKEGDSVVGKAMNVEKSQSAPLANPTLAGPENRLMILYHPSQSAQVADLADLLTKTIDVPADQVLIEGMVIELNENDLKQLGANWQTFGKDWQLSFLTGADNTPFIISHNPAYKVPAGLANKVQATLTAIINEGKAQVLSSPSVLVLNDRNAQIQITQDIPIFNTILTYNTSSFNVRFETVGITLNIRPRISQDGDTVAMQIVAQVSEAPPQDYVVINGPSVAPVINRRIVETVARVRNNTPFIIGGLIRSERDQAPRVRRHLPVQGPDQRRHPGRGRRRDPHDLRCLPQPAPALQRDP